MAEARVQTSPPDPLRHIPAAAEVRRLIAQRASEVRVLRRLLKVSESRELLLPATETIGGAPFAR